MEDTNDNNTQIEMPIKEKRELIYSVKRNLNRSIMYAGILPQWRNFMFVFTTTIGSSLILILSIYIYQYFSSLPDEIPLIYQQSTSSFMSISKYHLPFIPAGLFVFVILMIYLKGRIYSFDRRFVSVANVSELIIYTLILIGLSQLFSLVMV
jgi:hypothetical protein